MIVEFHILQNLPPANINRDDNGDPKTAYFGGVRRARISSQSIKRAMREYFSERIDEVGVRTSKIYEQVRIALVEDFDKSAEDADRLARAALDQVFDSKSKESDDAEAQPGEKSKVSVFADKVAFKRIAAICNNETVALEVLAKNPAPKGKKAKGDPHKDDRKRIAELVEKALTFSGALDIALFGRMLANLGDGNVDAAASVAHSISVNEQKSEYDFWTAMDDLQSGEERGSDVMGQVAFNSSCFYRYIAVDLGQLSRNVSKGNVGMAEAIELFTKAIFHALPTGMQHSFGAYARPLFGFISIREANLPLNLADAFMKPVRVSAGQHFGKHAIEALAKHWGDVSASYEDLRPVAAFAIRCGSGEAREAELGAMAPYAFDGTVESLAAKIGEAVSPTAQAAASSVNGEPAHWARS